MNDVIRLPGALPLGLAERFYAAAGVSFSRSYRTLRKRP